MNAFIHSFNSHTKARREFCELQYQDVQPALEPIHIHRDYAVHLLAVLPVTATAAAGMPGAAGLIKASHFPVSLYFCLIASAAACRKDGHNWS